MPRTRWSIRVDLIGGRGEHFWPRPGRIMAASRSHTFAQLAEAINAAFARWDVAHLYNFVREDGEVIGLPEDDDDFDDEMADAATTNLGVLKPGERFAYEFDFGDSWTHLCTVDTRLINPSADWGFTPRLPTAYAGWGTIPDQHGRTSHDDSAGADPKLKDLPPLIAW